MPPLVFCSFGQRVCASGEDTTREHLTKTWNRRGNAKLKQGFSKRLGPLKWLVPCRLFPVQYQSRCPPFIPNRQTQTRDPQSARSQKCQTGQNGQHMLGRSQRVPRLVFKYRCLKLRSCCGSTKVSGTKSNSPLPICCAIRWKLSHIRSFLQANNEISPSQVMQTNALCHFPARAAVCFKLPVTAFPLFQ